MTTKTLRQSVTLPGSPASVYHALTNPTRHTAFTGAQATGRPIVGGRFSAYDGYAEGIYRELVPNEKIVIDWRAAEPHWPADHFSSIAITLRRTKTSTRLTFVQTGVPAAHFRSIANGWRTYYWEPLRDYLKQPTKT